MARDAAYRQAEEKIAEARRLDATELPLSQKKDPRFGGLVRVQNKPREFLWVHERFASEY